MSLWHREANKECFYKAFEMLSEQKTMIEYDGWLKAYRIIYRYYWSKVEGIPDIKPQ